MTGISFGQALRNSIAVELASEQFYLFVASNTDDADAKTFLLEMAETEKRHAKLIENLAAKLLRGDLPQQADFFCKQVETAPDWRYVDNVSLDDALHVALQAEQQAALYYSALSDSFQPGPERDFFVRLAAEEDEHARRLQNLTGLRPLLVPPP